VRVCVEIYFLYICVVRIERIYSRDMTAIVNLMKTGQVVNILKGGDLKTTR
jgi:hypothetical protein